jgi:hypothetical protein
MPLQSPIRVKTSTQTGDSDRRLRPFARQGDGNFQLNPPEAHHQSSSPIGILSAQFADRTGEQLPWLRPPHRRGLHLGSAIRKNRRRNIPAGCQKKKPREAGLNGSLNLSSVTSEAGNIGLRNGLRRTTCSAPCEDCDCTRGGERFCVLGSSAPIGAALCAAGFFLV